MFYLHWNKIILGLLLVVTSLKVQSQNNLPQYDQKKIHYGFTVGFGQTNFKLNRNDNFYLNDTLSSIYCKPFAGFNLGVLANFHFGEFIDLRVIPSISFAQRNIEYTFRDSSLSVAKIESAYLELPVVFKIKSVRHRNIRFYVVAGFIYSYDLQSNKTADRKANEAFVAVNSQNFGYQIGCGLDLYFPYFKFSPELKLTNGFNNVLVKDNSLYTSTIDGLFSKII
ncbi:MAG: PorT family protein, partial [Bacteroidetes bacterium]|nr:PorT family protein [Bacteroidota bacterium]